MSTTETGTNRHPVVAYATLVRLPNLFTSPPDVVLGAALASATAAGTVSIPEVAGLAVASILLYAGGTTLNDYVDAEEDARERPDRPIPSGDVSRRVALALGVALLAGGVVIALLVAGAIAGATAGAVAVAVLLYDGVFKGSPVGFLFMGTSRGLNVLLGVAAGGVSPVDLPGWVLAVPAVVVLYIAAVTYMAEGETDEAEAGGDAGSRGPVLAAILGAAVAAAGVVALLAVRAPPVPEAGLAVLLLVGFLVWVGRPLRAAYVDPAPEVVGPAVGACVLGLTVLDAAFAATVGVAWAVTTLAFLAPAVGLSRVFDVT